MLQGTSGIEICKQTVDNVANNTRQDMTKEKKINVEKKITRLLQLVDNWLAD